MKFDVFFSISQTPVAGYTPSEAEMLRAFLHEVEAADALGFGTAWLAESHLSSEVQKRHAAPVIPHWQGEVGLNTDVLQAAHAVLRRTRRIEVGSAVTSLLCNGGPVAAAERVATFLAWHGLDPAEGRRLHLGFAGGRFEYMSRPYGVLPRSPLEQAAWPALKGRIFAEAMEIFLRLLRGDTLASDDVAPTVLTRADFRSDGDWERVRALAGVGDAVEVPRRYVFDALRIVPADWRRELLVLVLGSHEPTLQVAANRILPTRIFNLSITRPEIIDATHERMRTAFHPDGGPWRRDYMPRTVFVFLNEQPHLSPTARRKAAREEAREALGAYWAALEGTIDPAKVDNAADNALVGDAEEVAAQIVERFHPEDRLMLWFDFFNHDVARVVANMEAFVASVAPRVREALAR